MDNTHLRHARINSAAGKAVQQKLRGPDFILENHGTILLLKPQTAPAKAWIAEHLAHPETQTRAGGTVIEPRYWEAIEGGIAEEGLVVA